MLAKEAGRDGSSHSRDLWDRVVAAVEGGLLFRGAAARVRRERCERDPLAASGALAWHAYVKVRELLWIGPDTLLVMERGSATTKIYRSVLEPDAVLVDKHVYSASRPTLEELSAADEPMFPVLAKTLEGAVKTTWQACKAADRALSNQRRQGVFG